MAVVGEFGPVLAVPRGAVRCFAGATLADLRSAAREPAATGLAPDLEGRRILFHAVSAGGTPQTVLDGIVRSIAEAAFALYPRWYDRRPGAVPTAGTGPGALSEAARSCGASIAWLDRAVQRVAAGQKPMPRGFATVETARQLGLALAPDGLTLVLTVDAAPAPSTLLSHLAPWLADACAWSLALVFAGDVPADPEFDRVRNGIVRLDGGMRPLPSPPDADAEDRPPVAPPAGGGQGPSGWLWPVVGKPHPHSPAEQKLARLLAADEELHSLFTFNMPVRTEAGSLYLVDLLWAHGRLVVEVDGYGPHSGRDAFARDRHRDYELHASHYRVLRLTHDEIMKRRTHALSKIRTLVAVVRSAMAQGSGGSYGLRADTR